jgi:hypothetical protein
MGRRNWQSAQGCMYVECKRGADPLYVLTQKNLLWLHQDKARVHHTVNRVRGDRVSNQEETQ